jgi:hypothetical protein
LNRTRAFILSYRSQMLMCLFFALLVASPVADSYPYIGFALTVLLETALLAGCSYMASGPILRLVIYPLAVLWVLAHVAQMRLGEGWHVSPYIGLALSCSIVWGILSRFDHKVRVSGAAISEGIISYLIIAVAFSQLYLILDHHMIRCFNSPIPANQQSEYLYFSLSTITTVGYGDVEPVNHYVRYIAASEAVIGTFYIAVVISRLVAGYRVDDKEGSRRLANIS